MPGAELCTVCNLHNPLLRHWLYEYDIQPTNTKEHSFAFER